MGEEKNIWILKVLHVTHVLVNCNVPSRTFKCDTFMYAMGNQKYDIHLEAVEV